MHLQPFLLNFRRLFEDSVDDFVEKITISKKFNKGNLGQDIIEYTRICWESFLISLPTHITNLRSKILTSQSLDAYCCC